ncbi:3'-5' exonuclease [uncultured Polaribacter sp.]|uniref:3'-5' exonuclease n=1 Tax=uncultured Polaribacter sp. TaxID=174711 RepID=UPI0030DCAA32|tara:strand:+ start:7738 stop:8403 length:666 start_codon:yes stop_codon:yes gene_type:complete
MFWFRKKEYPTFWKSYCDCFKEKQNDAIENVRFVIFDTETTGLNPKKDRILSIGTIAVSDHKIKVADNLECYLTQDIFSAESVQFHGLLKEGNFNKISEEEAIIAFLAHIKNAVLVAHHAAFDVAMINQALKRLHLPKLKNKVLDTGHLFIKTKLDPSKKHVSLDFLSTQFNIPQHDRHTASGDAFITAFAFLKLLAILKKKNTPLSLKYLLKSNERIGLL